jgi:hypothetical protein
MAEKSEQIDAPVEVRLAALEAKVAAMNRVLERIGAEGWLDRVIGSTKDMPDFDEVVRYGREARQSQRPPDEVPA